jgi:hypothetical protein
LPTVPIIAGGSVVAWEHLGDQWGRAWFDPVKDAALIKDLRSLQAKNTGGVVEVNEEQFEAVKKNHPYRQVVRQDAMLQPIPSHSDLIPKVPRKGVPAAAVKALAEAAGVPVMSMPARPAMPPAPRLPLPPGVPPLTPNGVMPEGMSQAAPVSLPPANSAPPAPTSAPWKPPVENPEIRPVPGKIRAGRPKAAPAAK